MALAGFAAALAGGTAVEVPAKAAALSTGGIVGRSRSTSTITDGVVAPAVVALADAPSIAVHAALGNDFRVTLTGTRVMASPVGGVDGQRITFAITQGHGGRHTVNWSNQYKFSSAGVPVLSAGAGRTDIIGFIYNEALGAWLCVGVALGF
jgi:hypothetical protein